MIFGIVYAIGAVLTMIFTAAVMIVEARGSSDSGEPGDEIIVLFASALLWPLALILHVFHYVDIVSRRSESRKETDKEKGVS
jgi:hypothetical protein